MPEENPSTLFEKKREERPPVDILGLVGGLALFAGLSFLFAALSQLSGQLLKLGLAPKPSLLSNGVGIVLGVLAIFVYQRRPIGWYGTLVAAIAGVIQAMRIDLPFGLILIIYLSVPLVVLALLLVRRHMFLRR